MFITMINEMHSDPVRFAERVRSEPSLVTFVDHDGATLLHHAYVYPPVTRALLDAGADPNARNAKGETPVTIAAKWAATAALEMLVAAGGDPATVDREGKSPLDWANERGRDDVARILRREPEPDFDPATRIAAPPKERIRGMSVTASLLALVPLVIVIYIGLALLRTSLRDRSDYAAVARDGVRVEGTVKRYLSESVGHSRRVTMFRPLVSYRDEGGVHHERWANRPLEDSVRHPVGSTVEVIYARSRPQAAVIVGIDTQRWFGGALVGGMMILASVVLFVVATRFGIVFGARKTGTEGRADIQSSSGQA